MTSRHGQTTGPRDRTSNARNGFPGALKGTEIVGFELVRDTVINGSPVTKDALIRAGIRVFKLERGFHTVAQGTKAGSGNPGKGFAIIGAMLSTRVQPH